MYHFFDLHPRTKQPLNFCACCFWKTHEACVFLPNSVHVLRLISSKNDICSWVSLYSETTVAASVLGWHTACPPRLFLCVLAGSTGSLMCTNEVVCLDPSFSRPLVTPYLFSDKLYVLSFFLSMHK